MLAFDSNMPTEATKQFTATNLSLEKVHNKLMLCYEME